MSERGVGFASAADAVAHVFAPACVDELVIDGDDGHHLGRVRRITVGERVTVADGTGWWRTYAVTTSDRGRVGLRAVDAGCAEPMLVPRCTLAFAITKGDGPERVVAAATELGVDEFIPLLTERTVVKASVARGDGFTARLARVAREAAMQSRRARLPVVAPTAGLGELAGRTDLVVAAPDGDPALAPSSDGWCVVVGPEGGFGPADREVLAGAARLGVGPHVLRAVTAGIAVAARSVSHRRPSLG